MSQFVESEQQVIINVIHGFDTSLELHELMSDAHRAILEAALSLRDKGITPDLVTLHHELSSKNLTKKAGGASYISQLAEGHVVGDLEPYEDIVREGAVRRQIQKFLHSMNDGYKTGTSTQDLMLKLQGAAMNMSLYSRKAEPKPVSDFIFDVVEEIKARGSNQGVTGVPTPFTKLNRLLNGLQRKDLVILAGRPAMGKTAIGMQLAQYAARTTGPVLVFSMEMDKMSLGERILAGESRVPGDKIRGGYCDSNDLSKIQRAAECIIEEGHHILVDDTSRLAPQKIRTIATQIQAKYGQLALILVDYLGLMKSEQKMKRYLEVGEATKVLRNVAKDLNVPVLLLAQLNRNCEERDDKRPLLSDLRESGDIEQDSDTILFLYRDEYYCSNCQAGKDCDKPHKGAAEILVRKHRKGPTGTVYLTWKSDLTRFENMIREL